MCHKKRGLEEAYEWQSFGLILSTVRKIARPAILTMLRFQNTIIQAQLDVVLLKDVQYVEKLHKDRKELRNQ